MPRNTEERDGGQFYTGTGTGTDACETDVGDHPGGTEERSGCNTDSATGTGTFEAGDARETWDKESALVAFPLAQGWLHLNRGPCSCCGTADCSVCCGETGTGTGFGGFYTQYAFTIDGTTVNMPDGIVTLFGGGPDCCESSNGTWTVKQVPWSFLVESYTAVGTTCCQWDTDEQFDAENICPTPGAPPDGYGNGPRWRLLICKDSSGEVTATLYNPHVGRLYFSDPLVSCADVLLNNFNAPQANADCDYGNLGAGNTNVRLCGVPGTYVACLLSEPPAPPGCPPVPPPPPPGAKWWCTKQAFDGTTRRKCLQGAAVALDGPFDTEGDCTGACPEPTSWCVRFQDYDASDQPVGGSYLECIDLGVDPTEPVTSGSATNPGAVRREGTIEDGPWTAEDCPGACPPCGGDGGGTPGSGTATVDCTGKIIFCIKSEIRDGAGNPLSDATYACQLDTDGPPWTHVGQTVSQPIEGGSIVSEAIACYPDDGSCDAECGTTVTGGDAARKKVTVTPAGEVVPVPQARPPARPVRERPETPQGVIRRVREGSGQAVPRPVQTPLPVLRRNRCEHLGRRTERKHGCSGWKCKHDCGLGLPAVPGVYCQTCEEYEDSEEKF